MAKHHKNPPVYSVPKPVVAPIVEQVAAPVKKVKILSQRQGRIFVMDEGVETIIHFNDVLELTEDVAKMVVRTNQGLVRIL